MNRPTAALVDYGVGNMHSIRKALERTGFTVHDVKSPGDIDDRDAVVLPGVGAWTPAAKALDPLADAILDAAAEGRAILGVCLGMQLMYGSSEEGTGDGLGLFPGRVRRVRAPRIPHIGWTEIETGPDPLMDGLDGRHVYYVHSYAAEPDGPEVVATSHHGERFAAICREDRILGTQFHPEKSSTVGLDVLARFHRLVGDAR